MIVVVVISEDADDTYEADVSTASLVIGRKMYPA